MNIQFESSLKIRPPLGMNAIYNIFEESGLLCPYFYTIFPLHSPPLLQVKSGYS